MRGRLGSLLLLLLAACGASPAIPARDLSLVVRTDAEAVELGRAFPLRVVRIWHRSLEPEPWDDALLAPLDLVPESVERTEDAERVMETRRFRAYAFTRGDVVVRAPAFRARAADGGDVRIARADTLRLRVQPLLDPQAPGDPELPGAPVPERVAWLPLWLALGAVLLLGVASFVRARRVEPVETRAAPAPGPGDGTWARAALAALRADAADDPEAIRRTVRRLAELVRRVLAVRHGVRTRERTTPEILAALRSGSDVPPGVEDAVAAVLPAADLVKFAGYVPPASERDALLDAAQRVVPARAEAGR